MRSLMVSSLLFVLALFTAAELPAEGFVCAGHAVPQTPPGVAAKSLRGSGGAVPAQGRVNVLAIFAQFKDEAPENQTIPAYAPDLFDPDLPGSFSHFYHTMSFGQFQVEGTVPPKRYSSDQPAEAYLAQKPGEPGQFSQFVLEILQQADQDIDFSQFDNDGPDGIPNSGDDDGVVDYVFANMRSTPSDFLVGSATGIAGFSLREPFLSEDVGWDGEFIRIGGTTIHGAILQEGSFAQTVGAMAHEFGHRWGLPDLYDLAYGNPEEDSAGIGAWGLMGWGAHGWNGNDGPNPFCAWTLEQLGWIGQANQRLIEVGDDLAQVVLEDVQAGGSILKIPLSTRVIDSGLFQQEYLLLAATRSRFEKLSPERREPPVPPGESTVLNKERTRQCTEACWTCGVEIVRGPPSW